MKLFVGIFWKAKQRSQYAKQGVTVLIESLFWDIIVCRKPMILAQLYVDVSRIIFRRVGRRKWTNRRIRVPAFMRSCRIEEELTWVKTFDLMENEQVYAKTGFAPHRIPQSEGNHNGWLSEEEEADSDSESTTSNCPTPFEMEDQ
ncbi:hypothetical protein Tco_1407134 [Tanacetum coccineum]